MNPNHLLVHNPLSFEPIVFFRRALGCILWDIDLGLYPSPFSHGHILRSHIGSITHMPRTKRMDLHAVPTKFFMYFAMSFDIWRRYRRYCDEVTNFLVLILIALSA